MPLKPICVNCKRFYRSHKNGFRFLEGMPTVQGARPGLVQQHLWKPYKLWQGDLWKCEGCGHMLVAGTGNQPIDEHYTDSFKKNVAETEKMTGVPLLQINDC